MRIFSLTAFALLISSSAHAGSSLTFDSGMGFTSNGYLTANDPVADRILTVGGVSRFDLNQSQARASLKYTDYGSLRANDLVSADFGTTWNQVGFEKGQTSYGLKASLRDYIHDAPASTDQGYSHFGIIGDAAWKYVLTSKSEFLVSPRVDLEHYTATLNRNDGEFSSAFEYLLTLTPDSSFSFSVTPIALFSTLSDFSKLSLSLSADYSDSLDDDTNWGTSVTLTPGTYTSRTTGATATIVTRSKKGGGTSSTLSKNEKEATLSFTPGIWWSKDLTQSLEFRLETNLSLQNSRSGSYDFSEAEAWASLHYRVF